MKLIYIAAPYTSQCDERTALNVQVARHMGCLVAELGASPLMPTVNSAGFHILSRQNEWEFWMEATSKQLSVCDAAIFCQGWEHSVGCGEELKQAEKEGKPVFFDILGLHEWLKGGE